MNDDFIRKYAKKPRAEFEASLYLKLKQGEKYMKTENRPKNKFLFRNALAGAFLIAMMILLSPAARVSASQAFDTFVDIIIVDDETPDGESIYYPGYMTLSEVQSHVNFNLLLPAWVPEGFTMIEDEITVVDLVEGNASVTIYWRMDERQIELVETNFDGDVGMIEMKDALLVDVNGYTASVFSLTTDYFDRGPVTDSVVQWLGDGIVYFLRGEISQEDLLRVARSLQ